MFGFLLRVAEVNGYDDPLHVAQIAEFGRGQVQTPGLPVEKLAQSLGRDAAELMPIAYRSLKDGNGRFKILSHDLGSKLRGVLRTREPAFCPACVRQSGYLAAFWDLKAAVACPVHGCEVLRDCSECGQALRWRRPGLLTCNCGATLSGTQSGAADDATLKLMNHVQAKLYQKPQPILVTTCGFPVEALEKIPLGELLQVIEVLGSHSLWASGITGGATGSAAAACLHDWPHGYHNFLRAFGERVLEGGAQRVGLAKQFQPFYAMMFRNRSIARYTSFFREEFVRFGLEQWGHAFVDNKLLRVPKNTTERRFVSKSEFARRFGIWKPTMVRMIADGSVVTKNIQAGKSIRTVVDLLLSEVPDQSSGVVNVRDAADYLGLPVSVLNALRERGTFITKHRFGRAAAWHKEDVESFRCRGLGLPTAFRSGGGSVRLKDVMRLKLRDEHAKADVVVALFDGRLSVVGRTGENLACIIRDRTRIPERQKPQAW